MAAAYDVILVGGRVAGAAAALLLARRGARVLVLERGAYGSDTLSTHFIWPRGARRLAEIGLLEPLLEARTPPILEMSFDAGSGPPIRSTPAPPALCPLRTVLDRLLVDAAVAAGAEFRHRTGVDGVIVERARVRGVRAGRARERADLVIGADGRHSDLARLVGAPVVEAHPPQTAGYYAYFEAFDVAGAEFRLREGQLTYAWPTNDGLTCLYAAVRQPAFPCLRERVRSGGLAAAVIEDASLLERLGRAKQVSRLHGFASQGPLRRQRSGPGWVLIGDAAAFKDPTAGMGIAEALEDALWIASGSEPAGRVSECKRIFDFCRRAAELDAPSAPLAETYRMIAQSRTWSGLFFEVLGGEGEPRQLFGAAVGRWAGAAPRGRYRQPWLRSGNRP